MRVQIHKHAVTDLTKAVLRVCRGWFVSNMNGLVRQIQKEGFVCMKCRMLLDNLPSLGGEEVGRVLSVVPVGLPIDMKVPTRDRLVRRGRIRKAKRSRPAFRLDRVVI